MPRTWLESTGTQGEQRLDLDGRVLRVGSGEADLPLPAPPGEWLEIGGDPPRLWHHGGGAQPRVNGRPVRDLALAHGDRIEWCGATLVFKSDDPSAGLQPLAAREAPAAELDVQVAARLQAGLLCELDLVDRAVARRWQDAVIANAFDPDAAARELLSAAQAAAGDPRLRERSARLQRDLLMSPLQRGARGVVRRARTRARSLVAALVAQFAVLSTLACLAIVAGVVARLRWGVSLDAWLDRVIRALP